MSRQRTKRDPLAHQSEIDISTLNPCPQCGKDATLRRHPYYGFLYAGYCRACTTEGSKQETEHEAVDAWNRQAAETTIATLTAEVARLKALLGELVGDEQALYGSGYRACICCIFISRYDRQQQKVVFPHAPDCVVTRARAALAEDTPQ